MSYTRTTSEGGAGHQYPGVRGRRQRRSEKSKRAGPVQTLGELFQLLVRKVNRTPAQARSAILSWRDAFPLIETSETVIVGAAELAATHRFSFWDGVVLASAAEGGCRLLLSEDLQEGFTWNSVTVTNPFGVSPHPLLTDLLQ